MHKHGAILAAFFAVTLSSTPGKAQVFEVIHPDVVEGGFELEILNGVVLDDVEDGEERSGHEIAFAYSPTSWWKTTAAIEIANPENEGGEFEGFEWENVFLLPFGEGHGAGHSHDHSEHGFVALEAVGLFAALEVPNEGGIGSGAVEVGPIAEVAFGPVETVGNFLLEIPFEDDEELGLAFALQASVPVSENISVGFEYFGEIENAFEGESEDSHFIGPAIFTEFDVGRGRILEPRFAVLFGLGDETPDAVASLNLELKF